MTGSPPPFVVPAGPGDPAEAIALVGSPGHPAGHAVVICHACLADAAERMPIVEAPRNLDAAAAAVIRRATGEVSCDDYVQIARTLAPGLFPTRAEVRARHDEALGFVAERLVDAVYAMGRLDDQAMYERAYAAFEESLVAIDRRLHESRYLLGGADEDLCFADLLLFAFAVRIDPVYHELYKANPFLLGDLPSLFAFCRDLYERPEVHETTDWDVIRRFHYEREPVLNARRLVPRGGIPKLDVPHFRHVELDPSKSEIRARGVGEDQARQRAGGEWVRPNSLHRNWITPNAADPFPAAADRYHLYAPYNCPWSHRALLGRSVKGLVDVVGASVLYFRRHPEKGWQFNPAIPGCTDDPINGAKYLAEIYDAVGSSEGSAPVLWDKRTNAIVSNESADMLRMFDSGFGALAKTELVLVPEARRAEIDRMNELVYQRINNGAYKAGFAKSQHAYERAFDRYFAALEWLDERLAHSDYLVGTEQPTEADLRLFPTLYRHDAVYFTRFKLNRNRLTDFEHLSRWLERMLAWPGIAEASNLDHARNGYFGRTGNGIVPFGPTPLALSPASYPRDVWLNEASREDE